jgi:hypothetical protein
MARGYHDVAFVLFSRADKTPAISHKNEDLPKEMEPLAEICTC